MTNRRGRHASLCPVNADILKGLVWLCSQADDPEIARILAALAVSSDRTKTTKVMNACFWALGNMSNFEGFAQLSLLRLDMKTNLAQKNIARALETASRRLGVTADEIEEMPEIA
jgi:hypothetical protein